MKTISEDSLVKRLAFVKRRLKNRSGNSDQQLLRWQEQAHYSLLIFFGVFLFRIGIREILDGMNGLDWEFFLAVAVFLYFLFLCYSLFRLRWALEAFEQFGPQTIADLEFEISEQDAGRKSDPAPG